MHHQGGSSHAPWCVTSLKFTCWRALEAIYQVMLYVLWSTIDYVPILKDWWSTLEELRESHLKHRLHGLGMTTKTKGIPECPCVNLRWWMSWIHAMSMWVGFPESLFQTLYSNIRSNIQHKHISIIQEFQTVGLGNGCIKYMQENNSNVKMQSCRCVNIHKASQCLHLSLSISLAYIQMIFR